MLARRTQSLMASGPESDEELARRLLAPPDLDDGVQSLEFWRRRSRRLPWYRTRARREALRMTVLWEQRVGAALVSQYRVPLDVRLSAGVLVAQSRLGRWLRRARVAALATVAAVAVVVAVPAAAVLVYVLHAL